MSHIVFSCSDCKGMFFAHNLYIVSSNRFLCPSCYQKYLLDLKKVSTSLPIAVDIDENINDDTKGET